MDPTQEEEDRRARAEALARMAAIDSLGAQTHDALSPVTGNEPLAAPPGPRRIELPPDPTLDRIVAGSDSDPIPESPIPDTGTEDVIAPATALGTRDERHGMPVRPQGGLESEQERWERLGAGGGFRVPPAGVSDDAPDAIASGAPVTPVATPSDPTSGKPERDAARDAAAGPLPRLDAGLPTDEEIGRAHTSDDWRRPFFALGQGLLAAAGHTPQAFVSSATPLETERRAGIRAALERKGVLRGQERTAEAAQQRQDQQDELAQQRLALEERRTAATEAQIPSRVAATEALASQRTASAEDTRADVLYRTATREQRQDPDSAASVGERAALEARLGLMGARGEAERARIPDPATLNADQLHEIRSALTSGVGIRGMGGSGTGTSAGAPRADTRIAEAVRLGMFDDETTARQHMEAVGSENFDRELVSRQNEVTAGESAASRSRSPLREGEQGEEVFPGLHAGVRLATGEARVLRHDIGAVAGRMSSLGRMREIGDQFGWSGAISPEAAARVRPRLMALRSMAAQIQGTGVINPSEVETINASLPDPTDLQQMTFGTLRAALDEWQGMLEDAVRGNMGDTGIGLQEGPDALIRRLRAAASRSREPSETPAHSPASPSSAPEPSSGGGTVRMRRPDGTIAPNVPADRVDAAVARGWERL